MSLSISPKENEAEVFDLYNLPIDIRIYLLKFLPPKDRISLFSLCRKTRDAFFPIQEMWQGRSFETMAEIEDIFNKCSYEFKRAQAKVELLQLYISKGFTQEECIKIAADNIKPIEEKLETEYGQQKKPAKRCCSLYDLLASMHRLCISPTEEQVRARKLEELKHKAMEVFRQSKSCRVSAKCISENSELGLAIVARHIRAQQIRYKLAGSWNDKVINQLLQKLPPHCLPFILSIPKKAINEKSPDKYYSSNQAVVKVGESSNNHAQLLTCCWMTNQPPQIMRQAILDWTNYASKTSPFKAENHHMWGYFQNEILFALLIDPTADNLDFRKQMFFGILTECLATSLGMFRAISSKAPVHLTIPIFRTTCEENFRLAEQLFQEGPKYALVPSAKKVVFIENDLYNQLHKLRFAFGQKNIDVLGSTWEAIPEEILETHSITFFWMLCGLLYSLNEEQVQSFTPFIEKVCFPYMQKANRTTMNHLLEDPDVIKHSLNDLEIVLSYLKLKLSKLTKKAFI
jgi:hypothetical protein